MLVYIYCRNSGFYYDVFMFHVYICAMNFGHIHPFMLLPSLLP